MVRKILGLFLFFFYCVTNLAFADEAKSIQLAFWSPIQRYSESDSIKDLRLNLFYTDNMDVSGVTLGLGWAKTSGQMNGGSLGAVNWVDGPAYGFKGGLFNYSGQRSVGLDIGAVNIGQGDTTGVQLGVVNWNKGFFHGWQGGLVNRANGSFVGFQSGGVNIDEDKFSGLQCGLVNCVGGLMTGLQIGLVNFAESLNGVQIGLVDYNASGGPMALMVLANWSF